MEEKRNRQDQGDGDEDDDGSRPSSRRGGRSQWAWASPLPVPPPGSEIKSEVKAGESKDRGGGGGRRPQTSEGGWHTSSGESRRSNVRPVRPCSAAATTRRGGRAFTFAQWREANGRQTKSVIRPVSPRRDRRQKRPQPQPQQQPQQQRGGGHSGPSGTSGRYSRPVSAPGSARRGDGDGVGAGYSSRSESPSLGIVNLGGRVEVIPASPSPRKGGGGGGGGGDDYDREVLNPFLRLLAAELQEARPVDPVAYTQAFLSTIAGMDDVAGRVKVVDQSTAAVPTHEVYHQKVTGQFAGGGPNMPLHLQHSGVQRTVTGPVGGHQQAERANVSEHNNSYGNNNPPPLSSSTSPFVVGQRVRSKFGGRGHFYPARVQRCNVAGTYELLYADGDEESDVPASNMRAA